MTIEPICAACGAALNGSILLDPRQQAFCKSHEAALRVCRFCERGYMVRPGMFRDRCDGCERDAVSAEPNAILRYGSVVSWFRGQGLHFRGAAPPLQLQDRMPTAPNGRPMLGYTKSLIRRPFWVPSEAELIAVQRGLPRDRFGIVVAHELGHAWLVQQRAELSERIEEGICDWLAHAFALHCGTADTVWTAQRIATNPDPVNGEGFRRFKALAGSAAPCELPQLLMTLGRKLRA